MKYKLRGPLDGASMSSSKKPTWFTKLARGGKIKNSCIYSITQQGSQWVQLEKDDLVIKLNHGVFVMPSTVAKELFCVHRKGLSNNLLNDWDKERSKWVAYFNKKKGCD